MKKKNCTLYYITALGKFVGAPYALRWWARRILGILRCSRMATRRMATVTEKATMAPTSKGTSKGMTAPYKKILPRRDAVA